MWSAAERKRKSDTVFCSSAVTDERPPPRAASYGPVGLPRPAAMASFLYINIYERDTHVHLNTAQAFFVCNKLLATP